MEGRDLKNIIFVSLFLILFCCAPVVSQNKIGKISKVCLDAGHGGADAGACGRYTKEKDIALAVILKLGKMISAQFPDVEVIYTRKTDVFIPLTRRTEIANDSKVDLFISVHLNAAASTSASGIETLVLGTNNKDLNMQTAIRENSALKYESDYSVTRETFDPTAPESYIIFNLIRNVHLNESLEFASCVQSSLIRATGRRDRKVKQQPLWVLKDASMPAVLVEIGFISNLAEERSLRTRYDQERVASAICRAFGEYKRKVEGNSKVLVRNEEKISSGHSTGVNTSGFTGDWYYAVQIASFVEPLKNPSKDLKFSGEIDCLRDNGRCRYYTGATQSYSEALRTAAKVRKVIGGAFVIAIKDGKKVSIETLRKLEK